MMAVWRVEMTDEKMVAWMAVKRVASKVEMRVEMMVASLAVMMVALMVV